MAIAPLNPDEIATAARRKRIARRLAPYVIAVLILDVLLLASCSQSKQEGPCSSCVSAEGAAGPTSV